MSDRIATRIMPVAPVGDEECDHTRHIHVRPVVLCRETFKQACSVSIYITMRCFACGKKWMEDNRHE